MTTLPESSDFGSPLAVHVPKGAAAFPSIYRPSTFPRGENPRYGLSVVWDHPEFSPGLLQRHNQLRPYVHFKNLYRPPVNIRGVSDAVKRDNSFTMTGESIQWLVAELAGYEAMNLTKDRIFENYVLDLMVQPYKWEWSKNIGVGYRLLSVTLVVEGPWS